MLPGPSHSSRTSSPLPSHAPAPLPFLTETPECWVSNAELIVHYTTVAYRTLVFTDSMVQFLQSDLPRQAVTHTPLLQQLMAFAALHLAHTTPGSRQLYLLKASRQQDRAIRGLRAGLSGPVNAHNCHTLYVASIFLVLCKFASFAADEPRHALHACVSPTGSLLEIFTTISGMAGVFRPLEEHIRHGPFAGMFQRGPGVYSAEMVNLQNRLGELRAWIEADALPVEEGNTLLQAIDSLVAATVRCSSLSDASRPTGLRATFLWPMLVERGFVEMAEAGHPAGLVVVAHYCVLLSWSGRMLWCFERWAGSVIGDISDKIASTPWAGWMEWPRQMVASDSGESLP